MQLKTWAKHLVHLFDDFDKQIADWGIRPGFNKTRNKISTTDLVMLLFSCQTLSNFLRLYGLQHTTLLCPSLALGVCSNSCLLSQWYYLIISFSATLFSFCLHSFTASGFFFFPNESALQIRWPKCWSFSFSINPSNEYSVLSSFRIDCFDPLSVQGTQESSRNTTVWKHRFFGAQPSLWFISRTHTWLLEKP